MKQGLIISILIVLLTGLLLSSCDDQLTKVGTTIQPPGDIITVYSDTFQMKASTVRLDSIFAKTSDGLLGEMYDPVYGIIKADILCQFYCEEGFQFAFTPKDQKIDSIELFIYYPVNSTGSLIAYGDTLTPMQATVYPVNKPLTKNFYTNDQPENYCDMNNPLGSATYTLFDLTVSDSLRNDSEYIPSIRVKLPVELGQKFYDESILNPSTFNSQEAFNEFFPGIYVTNTYGSGCLVKTAGELIGIRIAYNTMLDSQYGTLDSVALRSLWFFASKEVVQINRFINSHIDQLLVENPTHTYIKSPAGVCTKLIIPTTEIVKDIDFKERFINGFSLSLKYLPEDERDYAYTPPDFLLLLPEDSVASFFEKGYIENNTTTYISFMPDEVYYGTNYTYNSADETAYGYSPYTRTYSFGNISRLLKTHIDNSPDKDLSLLVLPVIRKSSSYTYNNRYYYATTGISHSFNLSGVKIRTEDEYMKVVMLSSKYESAGQ